AVHQEFCDECYDRNVQLVLRLAYTNITTATATTLQLQHDPQKSFAWQLLQRHAEINVSPDPINRCRTSHCYHQLQSVARQATEQALSRLTNRVAASLKVIDWLPEATMLRVEHDDEPRAIYSLLR